MKTTNHNYRILGAMVWAITFCLTGCNSGDDDAMADNGDKMDVYTTPTGIDFVRTPEADVKNLPGWDYQYQYLEIDGLRQAYIDEGPEDAEPILLLHGQPTWSYLYRYMIPTLLDRGYRVVAMDLLGMGMSDKPVDVDFYTFDVHLKRTTTFIDKLGLREATVFMQDWGATIGLYAVADDLSLFSRVVLGNGGLPIVEEPYALPSDLEASNQSYHDMLSMIPEQQTPFYDENGDPLLPIEGGGVGEGFGPWMGYALYYEGFKPSTVVEALTYVDLPASEESAYNAPYPARITMAAPRIFPSLINDLVGRSTAKREALKQYQKPFLTIFGKNEPDASDSTQAWMIDNVPGAAGQPHHLFADASHFLLDDKGEEIARMVDRFIQANPK